MTVYKVMDMLGEQFKETDREGIDRVQFIYKQIAERIGSTDYFEVTAKLRDIERMIGVAHSPNRLYKIYQWIKLDGLRKNIEQEMNNVTA